MPWKSNPASRQAASHHLIVKDFGTITYPQVICTFVPLMFSAEQVISDLNASSKQNDSCLTKQCSANCSLNLSAEQPAAIRFDD